MMWFIGFLLVIGAYLLEGVYFVNAWSWFIVPLGVPAISFVHALGISTFISTIRAVGNNRKIENSTEFIAQIISAAFVSLVMFGIMALIHLFM